MKERTCEVCDQHCSVNWLFMQVSVMNVKQLPAIQTLQQLHVGRELVSSNEYVDLNWQWLNNAPPRFMNGSGFSSSECASHYQDTNGSEITETEENTLERINI